MFIFPISRHFAKTMFFEPSFIIYIAPSRRPVFSCWARKENGEIDVSIDDEMVYNLSTFWFVVRHVRMQDGVGTGSITQSTTVSCTTGILPSIFAMTKSTINE